MLSGEGEQRGSQEAVAAVQRKALGALDLGFGRKNEGKRLDKRCPFGAVLFLVGHMWG